MERVIKFERGVVDDLNEKKYVLQQEYGGFGIYQEKCPSGFYEHQSWLLTNEKFILLCESFNNVCKEELLDMIDKYNQTQKFGIKGGLLSATKEKFIFAMHPRCKNII